MTHKCYQNIKRCLGCFFSHKASCSDAIKLILKKGFEVKSGFSQFIFNDNFAPALFHTTASSPSPLPVKQTQPCAVKLTASRWLSGLHLASVSTWKNYHLELSVSPQLLCFYCSGNLFCCCQAPWLHWMAVLAASFSITTSNWPVSSQQLCLYRPG